MRIPALLFLATLSILFIGCSKEEGKGCSNCPNNAQISGEAQKGPFLNGSTVSLAELNNSFSPTGRVFNTNITDNSGAFEFNGITLSSNYVITSINGFYFNEVCGAKSEAPITLEGITDLSTGSRININVITHMEKARVQYLLGTGMTIADAKQQALEEVFALFEIDASTLNLSTSQQLSIAGSTEGDAALIAISSILQGYHSESSYSELMANIISDIRTDGALDDAATKGVLKAHALAISKNQIRAHIVNRYASMGISAPVPNFEKYVDQFIAQNTAKALQVNEYPEWGDNGLNLLNPDRKNFQGTAARYSLRAELAGQCSKVKVKLKYISGGNFNGWSMPVSSFNNWTVNTYDKTDDSQTFISQNPGICDLALNMWSTGEFVVEYYEGDFNVPSFTKSITFN